CSTAASGWCRRCAGRRRGAVDSRRSRVGESRTVLFEEVRAGGCMSYLLGCAETCSAVLVDPELSQIDRYLALAARAGLRLHYLVDTHTHADHFSAARELSERLGVPTVMHRASSAPYVGVRVDDGETLIAGKLRLRVLHTPGHADDSICLVLPDRVLTGDTLLRLATGRTDLPGGDPEALHDSLFEKLLRLDGALQVFPGHNYKGTPVTTLAQERAENPRLQRRERAAFVEQIPARVASPAGSSNSGSTRSCPTRRRASSPAASSARAPRWRPRRCARWATPARWRSMAGCAPGAKPATPSRERRRERDPRRRCGEAGAPSPLRFGADESGASIDRRTRRLIGAPRVPPPPRCVFGPARRRRGFAR